MGFIVLSVCLSIVRTNDNWVNIERNRLAIVTAHLLQHFSSTRVDEVAVELLVRHWSWLKHQREIFEMLHIRRYLMRSNLAIFPLVVLRINVHLVRHLKLSTRLPITSRSCATAEPPRTRNSR